MALATMLLTTGCLKLDMSMTIDKSDTVSGEIVFAVVKSLAEASKDSGDKATATDGLLSGADNVKVEPYDDGEYAGTKYVFEGVPLEKFKPEFNDDASAMSIMRDGDNLVVSGDLDSTIPEEDTKDNPFGSAIIDSFVASSSINVAITFPGEIRETSGKVNGQTITWVGEFGKKLPITAVVYAPLTPPIDWILIGTISGAAIISAILIAVVLIRKRQKLSGSLEVADPVAEEVSWQNSEGRLTLEEAMLIRPWYQQKRFVVPIMMLVLTGLIYWVSITN